jgi:glutamate/tyrosine decarboxylase-like PLP-dependent enzyme
MPNTSPRALLVEVAERASRFLDGLPERPVAPTATAAELRAALGGPLPDGPVDPARVIAELADAAEAGGLMATPGPRFFGFVVGGGLPAAVAADWLATAWDQNAFLHLLSPAAAVVEETAAAWVADLLGLPAGVSAGFVTGGQTANVVGLAAARHHVLARAGWDVEARGLAGAPPIRVLAGEERHVTVDAALRYLGLGTDSLRLVAVDDQGRMPPGALREALGEARREAGDERGGPLIVCAQAGNVNSGAVDPLGEVCDAAHEAGAWVHVDGAFGLWAAASPARRHLTAGIERADSWATDAHKWLNVPYDCGLVFSAHPAAHRAATSAAASYLLSGGGERDPADWVPELSRRARGFAVYAALRSLGRAGVAELVDRCCAHARRFAERLAAAPGVEVCNEVVLNQVLARFPGPDGDHDGRTRAVVRRVQEDGTCWLGPSTWRGMAVMRISVSNWSTTTADVDRSVAAILRAAGSVPVAAARPDDPRGGRS